MRPVGLTIVFGLLVIWPVASFGQPPRGEGHHPPPPHEGPRGVMEEMGMAPDDLRERDVRELVEVLRMAQMSKALGLDKEETVVLVRVFDEFKNRAEALKEERRDAMDTLKEAIRNDAGEGAIRSRLDELMKIDEDLFNLRVEAFQAASEDLTTEQKAKLYVFIQEFDQDLRRMIMRARGGVMRDRMRDAPEGRRMRDGDRRDGPPPPGDEGLRRRAGEDDGPPRHGEGPARHGEGPPRGDSPPPPPPDRF